MLASSRNINTGTTPAIVAPCFLVAKPGSTAMRLLVNYVEVNTKTRNHSGGIPGMENTVERIAMCRFKAKMDKRSGFWQVDLARAAQKLLTLQPLRAVSSAGRSCPSVSRIPLLSFRR